MASRWRADVQTGPALRICTPIRTGTYPPSGAAIGFDPKTQRLLALMPERTGAGSLTIVQNWLQKQAP